ncbi:MAG: bacillithiol biosynthesis cysteine-adding enzyme BshC [Bryobacterales bacterium]|nr:bacillithiol biosynthesis cysteine-adding enzyme BshC [Bryobacterales bacterium]
MDIVCKRHTELPHTSKLFGDLMYHFDRVAGMYAYDPHDSASYRKSAERIQFPDDRRQALIATLRKQNGDSESLAKLAKPGTVAVLTGQQVGLFSGPAYSVYKALTAVRLARQLTEQGVDAVPVFWLATEDHDFAEVSTCWTFDAGNKPLLLRLPEEPVGDRPVGGIVLRDIPIAEVEQSLAGFPFGAEVTELVREAYQPGRTMGEAFVHLMRALLKPYGLLFFDPMQPEARQLAAPLLKEAVGAAPELTEALLARNKELNDAGYHAQVHIERHTSLFFVLDNGHRLNLRRKDQDYLHKDRRWTAAELMDRAEALSPNAALRPVVQDYMFPTVAYIGGPAELAYLAQSEVIYKRLLGRMPVAASRNGFTLIDARTRKLMERYGLTLESYFNGEDCLNELIAAKLTPPEVTRALDSAEETVKSALAALRGSIKGFDKSLGEALDRSSRKVQYQLTKMHRKVARESLRRSQRALDESAYLFNGIYPHKHLQERFYTILPFLARHGLELVDRVYENVHPDCPDHHIFHV